MQIDVHKLIEFIQQYKDDNPTANKAEIQKATIETMSLERHRSLYESPAYSVRFSEASGSSFSNVVLSLSALARVDSKPLVVCVIRPYEVEFLLANTTFLKKISHSSHRLREDNVRGSFLGNDIVREYSGLQNAPNSFEKLFALHEEIPWEENLHRLVEATHTISGTGARYLPSEEERRLIFDAPKLMSEVIAKPKYRAIESQLEQIVTDRIDAILTAAQIDNINIRGNTIEQIITEGTNIHSVSDAVFEIGKELTLHIDIKTKLLHKSSAPTAYNIDKVLELLGTGRDLLAFFFIGIDVIQGRVSCRLVSIFDVVILRATRRQHHWAGRNSRGSTQLGGNIRGIFASAFEERIDLAVAEEFLRRLLDEQG